MHAGTELVLPCWYLVTYDLHVCKDLILINRNFVALVRVF